MTSEIASAEQMPAPYQADPGVELEPAEPQGKVMTLVEHLSELRSRIVKCILAVGAGSIAGFYFNREIRDFLLLPLPGHSVQVLNPGDAFSITVRIGLITGVILAMPILLYQAWAFISPGLTSAERRAIGPWIPISLLFFAMGVGAGLVRAARRGRVPVRASPTRRAR